MFVSTDSGITKWDVLEESSRKKVNKGKRSAWDWTRQAQKSPAFGNKERDSEGMRRETAKERRRIAKGTRHSEVAANGYSA